MALSKNVPCGSQDLLLNHIGKTHMEFAHQNKQKVNNQQKKFESIIHIDIHSPLAPHVEYLPPSKALWANVPSTYPLP